MFEDKELISVEDINCRNMLSSSIKKHIIKKLNFKRDIVIFCIGTDRATGDSLGPLVGTMLKNMGVNNVMGTIEHPVHAVNINDKITQMYKSYNKPVVLAIDACLGIYNHIGSLSIWEGAITPGAGISKRLKEVGDISITGIVNRWSVDGMVQLQSTRLSVVMNMAQVIADAVYDALKYIENN